MKPPIPVIFEDDHLLVVEKPVNMLSQADQTGDDDLFSLCKEYVESRGHRNLGLVHRLDRPVGGLLILAKSSIADKQLHQMIRDDQIQKVYLAVVHGITPSRHHWED